ncbi:MAG: amino acid decarboxylase [Stomatobaculum sp.]|nr:amino acid decarboxylase [Stomatobaculum sp.]
MTTPIYDFVTNYIASGASRLHMPGHKGHGPLCVENRDITEIEGADVLCEGRGIIGESEDNASALFGTGMTLYSTEGSSLAIRAMLYLALLRHRKQSPSSGRPVVLAARNVHKAFLYACAVLDCDVEWIYPENTDLNSVCSCHPSPEQVRTALEQMAARGQMPFAVYVTSPDYLGTLADVRRIADAVLSFSGAPRGPEIPLLVDNAHGAYLRFLSPSLHPMDLGAWMCCDSAHKTLPVLTGGAYLHLSEAAAAEVGAEARQAMALFGSSSPSYLILQSLDLCNRYLSDDFEKKLAETCRRVSGLKTYLGVLGISTLESEPLKLVIKAAPLTGQQLAGIFRRYGAEPEFSDVHYLVCMFTPENFTEDYLRIVQIFRDTTDVWEAITKAAESGKLPGIPAELSGQPLILRPLERVMTVREAIFSPHETIDVQQSAGRVLGQVTVSCPPAVPLAVSGERISEELIPIFQAYGTKTVSVLR